MKLKIVKSLSIIITFILAGCILPAAPEVTNDDGDGGGSSAPEINITADSVAYAHNSTFDFGSVALGSSIVKVFTITNTGSAVLSLTGDTVVLFSGTDTGMFQLSSQPSSSIAVDGTTTFIITYSPTGSEGAKSASIIILNSDSDEGSYKINLTGTTPGAAPTGSADAEIGVDVSDATILNNGTFDFGGNEVGSTIVKTFTISNSGTEVLGITGTPEVTTGDSSMFTVSAPLSPTVAVGSFTTFTVTYVPTGEAGLKTTTLTITNSDNSSFIITLTDTSTFTVSKVLLTGDNNYVNDVGISLTATVANVYDVTDTTFTGDIELDAGDFDISPSQLTIVTGGTVTANFTITKNQNFYDTNTDVTAFHTSLTSGDETVLIPAVLEGTEIPVEELSNGLNVLGEIYHIASRSSTSDSDITVNNDIIIDSGAKLIIYPGSTLVFATNKGIINNGELVIYGTSADRVKLTSYSSWSGIKYGNSNGSATINIDGVYINKTSTYPIKIGIGSTSRAGNATIINSRIEPPSTISTTISIWGYFLKGGSTYNINNNVIIAGNTNAIQFTTNLDSTIAINILSNTIISKGNSNPIAVSIKSSSTIVEINNNIISGSFGNAGEILSSSGSFSNNITNVGSAYKSSNTNTNIDSTNYLAEGENFTFSWNNDSVFSNYGSNDFTLKQTFLYPSLVQANNDATMAGSLGAGQDNEKGAYANGGYAPDWEL